MKTAFVASAFVLSVCANASAETTPDRKADEAALSTIKLETWPEFFRTQDADGLGAFLDPAFVIIGPDGALTTRSETLDGVRAAPWTPSNFRYEIGSFAWLNDNLVIIVGKGNSDREDDEGRPCAHSYTSSNLLERAPDTPTGWRALSSHVSNVQCKAD
ncbi:nuclear transport factor 2 family protein [Hyphococcus sp.]|uniref:nuclear transport factor 2 family protein n=1 Tax=Hyphococcus sp. TaxID=2038636 RepID=UPI003CCC107A